MNSHHDDRFDAAPRARHPASLDRLSAPPSPATVAGSVAASTTTAATMLDEDPEFYAWLASPDAQLVAME